MYASDRGKQKEEALSRLHLSVLCFLHGVRAGGEEGWSTITTTPVLCNGKVDDAMLRFFSFVFKTSHRRLLQAKKTVRMLYRKAEYSRITKREYEKRMNEESPFVFSSHEPV